MNEKNFLPDRTARATRRTPPCRPTRAPRRSPGWQSGCYKERRGAKSWPRKRPRQRSARHRGLPLQAGARVKAFTNNLQEFEHVDKTKTDNHDTWNVGANGPGLRRQTTVACPLHVGGLGPQNMSMHFTVGYARDGQDNEHFMHLHFENRLPSIPETIKMQHPNRKRFIQYSVFIKQSLRKTSP